jgi:hypothetical protein
MTMKSPPVELRELPTPGCGVRLVSVEEMTDRCTRDPAYREAISAMECAAGCTSEVRIAISKQLSKDLYLDRRADSQRRAIEYGLRRQKTVEDYESRVVPI